LDKISEYWAERTPFSWGTYEDMKRSRYDLHDYLYKTFELDGFNGKRVLSVGCGAGHDEIEMAKHGAEVWATDPSEKALELTRSNAEAARVKLHIEKADATDLKYGSGFFDHVHAFGVLHHIPDVNKAAFEIRRVLKKGGSVYAMLYHRDSLLYSHSILYLRGVMQGKFQEGLSEQEVLSRFSEGKEGCPYTRAYTETEAYHLFYMNGFNPIDTSVHYNVVDELDRRKVRFFGPSHLGWHLVVKAVK